MPTSLPNDLYDRLADRLRHAMQYVEAARAAAERARLASRAEREVVAMTAAPDDQLLRVEQYAEAAARALGDALALLEQAKKERKDG